MSNITMSEWSKIEAKVAADVNARWPWLRRERRGDICVESPAMAASAELRWSAAHGAAVVHVAVDRSGTITGGPADVAEAVRMLAEVRDAMLFIHGETSGLVVWRDGECPCSHCGGRGESRGRPCDNCGGKGKR